MEDNDKTDLQKICIFYVYVYMDNHAPAFYRARWLAKATRHV